jgi:hypothetical protein
VKKMDHKQRPRLGTIAGVYFLLLIFGFPAAIAGNVVLATIGPTIDYEPESDLSPVGRSHAEALGDLLSETGIDHVFVTPYPGTRQTAAAIASKAGITAQEFSRSQLANLAGELIKTGETVVVVAWEADLRVLWRQLDLKANLTTQLNGRILLLRPDVPGLPALVIRVPKPGDPN